MPSIVKVPNRLVKHGLFYTEEIILKITSSEQNHYSICKNTKQSLINVYLPIRKPILFVVFLIIYIIKMSCFQHSVGYVDKP